MSSTPAVALPIVPPLTSNDTSLSPSQMVSTYVAWVSPWIELGSFDPVISSVSRQILNLEVAYANFCGIRSVVIPGPRAYGPSTAGVDLAQYARAVQEALAIGNRMVIVVYMPMVLDNEDPNCSYEMLSSSTKVDTGHSLEFRDDLDSFQSWDAWNTLRSLCNYNTRLSMGENSKHLLLRDGTSLYIYEYVVSNT